MNTPILRILNQSWGLSAIPGPRCRRSLLGWVDVSSTYAEPLDRVAACLDDIAAIDPVYRTVGEKQEALVALHRRPRSTATWLAEATRDAHGTLRRSVALARRLEETWTQVAAALGTGSVNLA